MNFEPSPIKLYQIVILLVAVFMIIQGFSRWIKRETGQTFLKLFLRFAVWGGMAVIALFPSVTNVIARFIGIEGNINAVILTGFILIFLVIFKLIAAIERVEEKLTILTRKDSLKPLRKKKRF